MKQYINKGQWNEELNGKQRYKFINSVNGFFPGKEMATIGQMIEFLGDDLKCIENNGIEKHLKTYLVDDKNLTLNWSGMEYITILWGAVKYKLNEFKN